MEVSYWHDSDLPCGGSSGPSGRARFVAAHAGTDAPAILYAQAKCYRPDHAIDVRLVRDFSGSLDDKKSARGVLMTTSRFTSRAEAYVRGIRKPIALVDGARLARLMIEHGVGVRKDGASTRKKLDENYFMRMCGAGGQP